jgi:drug/metabolite transporter (DMT)-like permease
LVLGSALTIAISGALVKEALNRGGEPESLLSVRYLMAAVLLGLPLIAAGHYPRSRRGLLLAGAIGVTMWTVGSMEFVALDRLPLSVVIVLLFISPVWVALYSRLVRGERLGWQRHVAFLVVFIGIVLLVGPKFEEYDLLGVALAIGSSLGWALILILIDSGRRTGDFSAPAAVGTAVVVAGAIGLIAEPGALANELGEPDRLPYVLGFGVAGALALRLFSLGMQQSHVFDVVVVGASEPMFAVVLGATFFDERLGPAQLLGIVLVAAGVIAVIRSGRDPVSFGA